MPLHENTIAVVRNKSAIGRRVKPGERFSRLVTISFTRIRNSNPAWICQCDCGNQSTTIEGQLLNGKSKSCGCLKKTSCSKVGKMAKVHGMSNSPTWKSWASMRWRCRGSSHKGQKYYGAKGVQVCERWRSFSCFLADMGQRPSLAHTIDRIDPDGNYEPVNCRWANHFEQAHNRSNNHKISAFGEYKCLSEWARDARCVVSQGSLSKRIRRGLDPESALTKPRNDPGRPR